MHVKLYTLLCIYKPLKFTRDPLHNLVSRQEVTDIPRGGCRGPERFKGSGEGTKQSNPASPEFGPLTTWLLYWASSDIV